MKGNSCTYKESSGNSDVEFTIEVNGECSDFAKAIVEADGETCSNVTVGDVKNCFDNCSENTEACGNDTACVASSLGVGSGSGSGTTGGGS